MTKKLVVVLVVLAVCVGFVGRTAHAEDKIALVSLQRALNDVEEGKKAKDMLKVDYESKKKKLEDLKTQLDALYAELDKQKNVLSKEALSTKVKELQTKRDDWQSQLIAYEKEFRAKESESTTKIMTGLQAMVLEMAKSAGYTLLIENSANTVLYSASATDITDKLIATYNSKKK